MKPLRFFIIACAFSSVFTAGPNIHAQNERILVPSIADDPVPGAFGSQWVTEIVGQYVGTGSTEVLWPLCHDFIPCSIKTLEQNDFFGSWAFFTESSPHGGIMTVWAGEAKNVIISARVRDLSRGLLTWGTELPIARESEVQRTPITLLNVPNSDRFRVMIRMYDFEHITNVFNVKFFALTGDELLAEVNVPATDFRSDEGTRFGMLHAVLADPVLPASAPERLRVVITTQNPVKFWAFAAITNNETQHVTVVSPTRPAEED